MPHDGDILLEGLTSVEATTRLKELVYKFHKERRLRLDSLSMVDVHFQTEAYSVTPTQCTAIAMWPTTSIL